MCVDFLGRPLSVGEALESLADTHVCEPVDIALWRYVEVVSFECVGRVRHDVQVPREAETLAVHGHESEVNAGLSFDEEGVHDVVVVEGDGQRRGEWAHEAIEHDVDVVGEYVDGLEDSLYILTNASVVQQLVKSVPSLCLHHFALFGGVELGIFVRKLFANTDSEDRRLNGFCPLLIAAEHGAVDTDDGSVLADTEGVYLHLAAINTENSVFEVHGIDEVLQETELAPELVLVEVEVEGLDRHDEFFVTLFSVGSTGAEAVLVLLCNHIFNEFDGGVAFASVGLALLLGLHHDILQGIDFGLQRNEEFGLTVGFDREGLGFVSHHAKLKGDESTLVLYDEIAIEVAGGTDGGTRKDYLHKRECLAGVGVDHAAGYARYTCPQPDGEQEKQQQHDVP